MPLISSLILTPALGSNIVIPRQTQLMAHVYMHVRTLEKDVYRLRTRIYGLKCVAHQPLTIAAATYLLTTRDCKRINVVNGCTITLART